MTDAILDWNQIALDAVKRDHTTRPPDTKPKGEQAGPTRTSRALAMVHLAMYDAFSKIAGGLMPYMAGPPAPAVGANIDAAIGEAACLTLLALYPSQEADLLQAHRAFFSALGGGAATQAIEDGKNFGEAVALAMLQQRKNDGATTPKNYAPSMEPGRHRPDPLHPDQSFHAPHWGSVTPFVYLNVTTAVVSPPPPGIAAPPYAAPFNEVKAKGGASGGTRTADETVAGIFWGYDGAEKLGTPPRLYNQIVREIAISQGNTLGENARLFALVNAAMADAGIQCWFTKYTFEYWRPVVGIREAFPGSGPTGKGDGNNATQGDARWLPLGAPTSNGKVGDTSLTPAFPSYTSGHATFGAAALWMVKLFYGTDDLPFTFTSDEFSGETRDADGSLRPRIARSYATISSAIDENGNSRVFLGVHWRFDSTAGVTAGKEIAEYIFANALEAASGIEAGATREGQH